MDYSTTPPPLPEPNPPTPPVYPPQPSGPQPQPASTKSSKGLLGLGALGVILLKFAAKLKFLLPALKFLPALLKTGGTMLLTMWVYALNWGWRFAAGFVLLILIHECGHLIAARYCGLNVGAPVFIPFMGAFIALKDAPKNAWIEAIVGIGGPALGSVGALLCALIGITTGKPMFLALAYTGFFLNLFNLTPIGFLDGGRIAAAVSPLLWLAGGVVMLGMMFYNFNFLLLLIFISSLPRIFSLFRKRNEAEQRYFDVTPQQRWIMSVCYFGLAALLALAMQWSYVPHHGE